MKPSLSVIAFTVLAGAGYGLWIWLGLALGLNVQPYGTHALMMPLGTGLALTSAGLLSSTLHLGKPLRGWRGLTQWRSSWLSREAVLALLGYLPVLALVALRHADHDDPWLRVAGLLLVALSLATVYSTARIYTSLKPIAAWRLPQVLPGYLLLALASGGVWLWLCLALHLDGRDLAVSPVERSAWLTALLLLLVSAAALKRSYWRALDILDARPPQPDAGAATGLDRFGHVRALEAPNSEPNYLLREMGFVLARRHSRPLRQAALLLGFVLPLVLVGVALLVPLAEVWVAVLAVLAAMGGLFMERWLFFAEARHQVVAYYPTSS
jgi:DMSO reductase anchor subunit